MKAFIFLTFLIIAANCQTCSTYVFSKCNICPLFESDKLEFWSNDNLVVGTLKSFEKRNSNGELIYKVTFDNTGQQKEKLWYSDNELVHKILYKNDQIQKEKLWFVGGITEREWYDNRILKSRTASYEDSKVLESDSWYDNGEPKTSSYCCKEKGEILSYKCSVDVSREKLTISPCKDPNTFVETMIAIIAFCGFLLMLVLWVNNKMSYKCTKCSHHQIPETYDLYFGIVIGILVCLLWHFK